MVADRRRREAVVAGETARRGAADRVAHRSRRADLRDTRHVRIVIGQCHPARVQRQRVPANPNH